MPDQRTSGDNYLVTVFPSHIQMPYFQRPTKGRLPGKRSGLGIVREFATAGIRRIIDRSVLVVVDSV